ncbi:MAG: hypothetical protein H7A53_00385 [Akkermansiaceae bacterium]|nr:hypothetical protein [Akkermansiaceae bacterium]MCP5549342.1 hypothetical protein [Akkermansiaceae bacterium]
MIAANAEEIAELESLLARCPEDWSVRLRLIEERIARDDTDGARRLVRESPGDGPLPPELQYRLHTLMTRGKTALGLVEALPSFPAPPPAPVDDPRPEAPTSGTSPNPSAETESTRSEAKPEAKTEEAQSDGLSRLARLEFGDDSPPENRGTGPKEETKDAVSKPAEAEGKLKKSPAFIGIRRLDLERMRAAAAKKWSAYDGDLLLTPIDSGQPVERPPSAPQKASAVSLALLVHIVSIVVLGTIIISVPVKPPPQLVVTVAQSPREIDLVPMRIVPPSESKPSAASALAANVIGVLGDSSVSIPEMEKTDSVDVTALITGVAAVGQGMSFTGDTAERSDVNFFGISSGGRRIVFIVDATPFMLLDEKGGMFAYDKVKDEISIMLAGLNRGTWFNILLYEGGRLMAFAEEPVQAYPSNLRLAAAWLDPLNRDYNRLGLRSQMGTLLEAADEIEPIASRDLAHYAKAIQKAAEWRSGAIFCISSGYRQMRRSPTPEMEEEMRKRRATDPGTPGSVSQAERNAWNQAVQRTRQWLRKENDARKEKGLPPKVVVDFNALVLEITGATPPRPQGGTPPGGARPNLPPYTPEDIETQVKNAVARYFRGEGKEPPSLHMVVFLGEGEDMDDQTKDHFQNLTRKNNGKFKLLRGLAQLEDVTQQ